MRRTGRKVTNPSRRATDELLLARLLGVAEQLSAPSDTQADEQLLHALLLAPPAPPDHYRRSLRTLLLALTAVLALFTCVPLGAAAGSLLAIRNNVAAMRQSEHVRIGSVEVTGQTLQGMQRAETAIASAGARQPAGEPGGAPQRSSSPTHAPQQPKSAPPAVDTPPRQAGTGVDAPAQTVPIQAVVPAPAAERQAPAPMPAGSEQGSDPRPSPVPASASEAPSALSRRTEPEPEAAITVLLLGVDRRPEQTGPARADSVIVARIDPRGGRVALVSFPRDLLVEIPGVGWDRINAMTVYGEMYPELGGSLELSRRTVETLLGIPIDHAVSVDFGGFISAVDALGGITVDVEREVYDSFTENHFAAGPQHMDGRTALWYSRIRFLDNDFERMRRQQSVILALLGRIREQNALQRLHSIAAVTGAMRGYIQTDIPEDRIVRLAWSLRNFAPEAVEQYRLEVDQVDIYVNAADPYAQYIRPGAAESLTRKLIGQ